MDISAVYQDGIGLRRNMKIYTNQDERLHSVRQTMTLKDMWLTGVELYGDKPAFCVKEERGVHIEMSPMNKPWKTSMR